MKEGQPKTEDKDTLRGMTVTFRKLPRVCL